MSYFELFKKISNRTKYLCYGWIREKEMKLKLCHIPIGIQCRIIIEFYQIHLQDTFAEYNDENDNIEVKPKEIKIGMKRDTFFSNSNDVWIKGNNYIDSGKQIWRFKIIQNGLANLIGVFNAKIGSNSHQYYRFYLGHHHLWSEPIITNKDLHLKEEGGKTVNANVLLTNGDTVELKLNCDEWKLTLNVTNGIDDNKEFSMMVQSGGLYCLKIYCNERYNTHYQLLNSSHLV